MKKLKITLAILFAVLIALLARIISISETENSALAVVSGINFRLFFEIAIFSATFALLLYSLIMTAFAVRRQKFSGYSKIALNLSIFAGFLVLTIGFLKTMTESQFSLVATFVGLPFLVLLPKFGAGFFKLFLKLFDLEIGANLHPRKNKSSEEKD